MPFRVIRALTASALLACSALVSVAAPARAADPSLRPLARSSTITPVARGPVPRVHRGATPHALLAKFNGAAEFGCGCLTSNTSVAASATQLVQVTRGELSVFTKTGTLLAQGSLEQLVHDTEVVSSYVSYDTLYHRWVIAVSISDSSKYPVVHVLASTSDDATGGWSDYPVSFDGPLGVGGFAIHTLIGNDQDAVAITTDNYDGDYTNSTVFTLSKARIFNAAPVTPSGFLPTAFLTAPANVDGQSNRMYLLSADADADLMRVYYLTDTAKGVATKLHERANVSYSWDIPTRFIRQPNGAPLSAYYGLTSPVSQVDGKLWFANGADLHSGSSEFPIVNWGYLNASSLTLHLAQAFRSSSSDDFDPAITVTKLGSAPPTEVLSWSYTDVANNVPVTTAYAVSSGYAIHSLSAVPYSANGGSTSEDYGSISSAAFDPTYDGTCASGQYAVVSGQYYANDGTWKTRIARVGPSC